jgi:protein-L-isoaspartate(D-aspartate) O-methyltransferase
MLGVLGILLTALLLGGLAACSVGARPDSEEAWDEARAAMVEGLRGYGVTNAEVLRAMAKVRRHVYIPEAYRERRTAYGDHPFTIGHGQTISQPYIVAYMTEKMAVRPGEKVLEIGTGSGYQAAVLAELGAAVYTVEIVPELAAHARRVLEGEGYRGVHVRAGDGYKGWPEHAPFDVVIVTCAPTDVPAALVAQLAEGGRMILPVGDAVQRLVILRKQGGRVVQEDDLPVRFVPMVRGREGAP